MSVRGRRGDDASNNNHVGTMVPEEQEEHGYRSVNDRGRVRFRHNTLHIYHDIIHYNILYRDIDSVSCVFKGFCLAVRMLGSAATYIIVPNVVSVVNNGPLKPFILRSQIMHMLYACTET